LDPFALLFVVDDEVLALASEFRVFEDELFVLLLLLLAVEVVATFEADFFMEPLAMVFDEDIKFRLDLRVVALFMLALRVAFPFLLDDDPVELRLGRPGPG
jgi:hypothetical protein